LPPNLTVQGFAGGGQAGFNMQTGNFVYGFETDFTGMNARGTSVMSPFFTGKGANTVTWTSEYSWLYTARLRGGITINGNWLIYGTGGLAVTSVHDLATCNSVGSGCGDFSTPEAIKWSKTSTLVGGVVGGGIQTMLLPNWIVGLEVLHVILPSTTPGLTSLNLTGTLPPAFSFNHNLTLVMFEVDYKFGGP
jgi:outer membrane immunogenic protein